MAYANFKPEIWSKYIQHELKKMTVFEQDCNYQFKGEVGRGKTVNILGVTQPTIGTYTGENIAAPETQEGVESKLEINQAKYFNIGIDDVDEAQSIDGLMQALMLEATRGLAETRDSYIAGLAQQATGTQISGSTAITDADSARAAVDAALVNLRNNGVRVGDKVTMYLTPTFYMHLFKYITETKSNNDATLANGVLGMYGGARIKMTNNAFNDGTDDLIIVKTDKAIAFASGINSVEAYRPEGKFMDAVKGLNLYGGKLIRPKEMYVIKAHYA